MDAVNQGIRSINDGFAYLKSNAWPILFMLALWFYLKPRVMAAMDDAKTRRNPQQIRDYDNDLRRVRQMQQLQAEQDAKIKAQKEKSSSQEVVPQEKKKKPIPKKPKATTSSAESLSMNNFSSPSYRPQRRQVRRGTMKATKSTIYCNHGAPGIGNV
ncbi:expressed unknown protein [Seminavis robusta]|uniref:Selenoprotein S n=1 Tax=Seminavis robusta TaxID=568900 RepID=A0A9N8HAF9_9STRA|nr:expressed unknown protein [Seminavis robusta]|eukprot:Sro294_g110250.1 n/a (157) ;mRNA; r:45443-46238